MNITELDEWQGLTADLVREWLKRTGWEPRTDEWGEKRWFNGNGRSIADKRVLVTDGFRWIASQSDQTVQAILREINPRMRKGMPSEAAREAHGFKGGMWVGSRGEAGSGGTLVFVSFDDSSSGLPLTVWDFSEFDTWEVGQSEIDDEWLFWPADESGNKTRWPTDAEGNML
jgi:hypothetical protein